jgi:adenylosuccinate synthase
MSREAVLINGITELAIMKMDVLDGLKTIKLCVAYKYKGKTFKGFPYDLDVLKNAKPVYKEVPGWPETLNKPRSFQELHPNAKAYLKRLSDILRVKISMVSVGSAREDTIFIM